MHAPQRRVRHAILEEGPGVGVKHSSVAKAAPAAPVGRVVRVGPGVFDAQEVHLGTGQRPGHKKSSLAHSDLDFQRVVVFEQLGEIDRPARDRLVQKHSGRVGFGVFVASKMFRRVHSHRQENTHFAPWSKGAHESSFLLSG
jgi:hypothetical protein